MSYAVKEIYYTIQGEGLHVGRPAVFCRFAGCNLWSGREDARERAICKFCDTDFVGIDGPHGGDYPTPEALAQAIANLWPANGTGPQPMVVCTGGEPLLQLDEPLIHALHTRGFYIAVESNGTRQPPPGIDWLCISPKAGTRLLATRGNELKLVYPQPDLPPADVEHLDFQHFLLQPMDGPQQSENTQVAADYCMAHPKWRLSLQLHKMLGLR